MIEIENLTMRFGELIAVDRLDLTIPKGELFAFLGPNGAGKTTTIKMITGLLRPVEGCVRICGYDLTTQPLEAKSQLGYVPDVAVFYEKLTGREFLRFIGDLYALSPARCDRVAGELIEQFGLDEFVDERIENLSHGTCQRLAIAGALLHDPRVIVIDEPMVGLDPIHARVVKDEFRARAEAGVTVLMSTHLLNVAEELADRLGIMAHGKMLALGTPAEIRREAGGAELEEIFLARVAGDPSRFVVGEQASRGSAGTGSPQVR
jgi:ABC-2 type transport system ATP-binding protein